MTGFIKLQNTKKASLKDEAFFLITVSPACPVRCRFGYLIGVISTDLSFVALAKEEAEKSFKIQNTKKASPKNEVFLFNLFSGTAVKSAISNSYYLIRALHRGDILGGLATISLNGTLFKKTVSKFTATRAASSSLGNCIKSLYSSSACHLINGRFSIIISLNFFNMHNVDL
jgi:hypothetical protein